MTGRLALQVATIACVLYAAMLLSVPSDVGFATPWFVLSPARLALAIGIVVAALDWAQTSRPRPRPPRPVVMAWAAFLLVMGASAFVNRTPGSASRWISYLVEGAGVTALAWWIARRGRGSTVEGAVILATVAVAMLVLGSALLSLSYDDLMHGRLVADSNSTRFGIERQQGPFDAPLFYAVWLVAAVSLAFGRAFASRRRARAVWSVAWVVLLVALLTTVSRVAIAAVPAAMAAIMLLGGRPRSGLALVGVAAVTAVVAFAPGTIFPAHPATAPGSGAPTAEPLSGLGGTPVASGPRPSSGDGSSPAVPPVPNPDLVSIETSNSARFDALVAALRAAAQRPLLGWGPLSAKNVANMMLGKPNYVDNTYLVVLIEGGVLGLAALLALMIATLGMPWLKPRPPDLDYRLVASTTIVFFCAAAAFLSTSSGFAAFWLLAALSMESGEP